MKAALVPKELQGQQAMRVVTRPAASVQEDWMCQLSADGSSCHGGGSQSSLLGAWAPQYVPQPQDGTELQGWVMAPFGVRRGSGWLHPLQNHPRC